MNTTHLSSHILFIVVRYEEIRHAHNYLDPSIKIQKKCVRAIIFSNYMAPIMKKLKILIKV